MIDKRACFKFDLTDEDEIEVRVPELDLDGRHIPIHETEPLLINEEELLHVLADCEEMMPTVPPFVLLMNKKLFGTTDGKEICPIGLIDPKDHELIMMEGLCDAYKMAPAWPPALDQQPHLVIQGFAIVRAERNRYLSVKHQQDLDNIRKK